MINRTKKKKCCERCAAVTCPNKVCHCLPLVLRGSTHPLWEPPILAPDSHTALQNNVFFHCGGHLFQNMINRFSFYCRGQWGWTPECCICDCTRKLEASAARYKRRQTDCVSAQSGLRRHLMRDTKMKWSIWTKHPLQPKHNNMKDAWGRENKRRDSKVKDVHCERHTRWYTAGSIWK